MGAGLAGATIAERLASQLGAAVLVIDQRPHVAGNCYDPIDDQGLRQHRYGPHIFHTNAPEVISYLSRFTNWRPYEHRVLARIDGALVPIPINRTTINRLYGLHLDSAGVESWLRSRAVAVKRIDNSRDTIVAKIGQELYAMFFEGYTRKQWGLDPTQLDAGVCGRIPTRFDDDDRYFNDRFQCMPVDGFEAMFAKMLAQPSIEVALGLSFARAAARVRFRHLVYTGPIDEYFDHRFGPLPYRSLRFEFETLDREWAQPVGCVNEPSEKIPYTRTTEYKHITGQSHPKTVISREFATAAGEPFYPIPSPDNRELLRKYQTLVAREPRATFVGRLAEYRYFNMDQVVASALAKFEELARAAA